MLFDSGVRTGADAALALALGADAVLLGRPYVYGLALGGEDGVATCCAACWPSSTSPWPSRVTDLAELRAAADPLA